MKRLIISLVALFTFACAPAQEVNEAQGQAYEYSEPVTAPAPEAEPTYYPEYYPEVEDGLIVDLPSPRSLERRIEIPTQTPEEIPYVPTADDLVSQLTLSSFVYNVPDEANIDDEVDVSLIINPLATVEELQERFDDGNTTAGRVQISRVVQAKLDSNDFEITPITPTRQVVMYDRDTKWLWSLNPKSAGENKKIKITITAILTVDGERTERYIDTYTDTITIDITTKQIVIKWLEDNWQWAWGALLIPVLGAAWTLRKRRNPQ